MQMIFPLLPQNVANAKGKKNSSMPRNLFHFISYKLLQIKWGLKCRLNSGKKLLVARHCSLFCSTFELKGKVLKPMIHNFLTEWRSIDRTIIISIVN